MIRRNAGVCRCEPDGTAAEDARLMAEADVNLVSVGTFSWSQLEPSPGRRNHPHGTRV